MRYPFLIIESDDAVVQQLLQIFENFPNYFCVGIIADDTSAIDQIYKLKPQLVFAGLPFSINPQSLSCSLISEMHQYSENPPYFIAMSSVKDHAFEAIQNGFSDYMLKPIFLHEIGKSISRFERKNPAGATETICIKSYSDYQFLALKNIIYLKADNNTTDIQMISDKTVNAFKTLKHFENTLPFYFLRIHKSYIVNINHVSRIHISKLKCYLGEQILPFSMTYKDNIDGIMRKTNM